MVDSHCGRDALQHVNPDRALSLAFAPTSRTTPRLSVPTPTANTMVAESEPQLTEDWVAARQAR